MLVIFVARGNFLSSVDEYKTNRTENKVFFFEFRET